MAWADAWPGRFSGGHDFFDTPRIINIITARMATTINIPTQTPALKIPPIIWQPARNETANANNV